MGHARASAATGALVAQLPERASDRVEKKARVREQVHEELKKAEMRRSRVPRQKTSGGNKQETRDCEKEMREKRK